MEQNGKMKTSALLQHSEVPECQCWGLCVGREPSPLAIAELLRFTLTLSLEKILGWLGNLLLFFLTSFGQTEGQIRLTQEFLFHFPLSRMEFCFIYLHVCALLCPTFGLILLWRQKFCCYPKYLDFCIGIFTFKNRGQSTLLWQHCEWELSTTNARIKT